MSANEVDLLKWPDPLPGDWRLEEVAAAPGYSLSFEVYEGDQPRGRCETVHVVHSEIKDAYPISARDQLVSVSAAAAAGSIQLVSEELMRRDPLCRRLVIAADEEDLVAIARAEAAGYRYVVDVDLYDRAVSLLVAEPDWVLEESRHIDDVPTI